jgi:hypothetical protein
VFTGSPAFAGDDEIIELLRRGRPLLRVGLEAADEMIRVHHVAEHARYAAAVLLKRPRNAGLSDYEPDPLRAVEQAEAARRPAA